MYIYLSNKKYKYEVFELIRSLIGEEKTIFVDNKELLEDILIIEVDNDIKIEYYFKGELIYNSYLEDFYNKTNDILKDKIIVKREILKFFIDEFNISSNWGVLTGIRPVKVARKLLENYGFEDAKAILVNELLLRKDKASLILNISQIQKSHIDRLDDKSYSLYINIPFCPTRCDYCSYSTLLLGKNKDKVMPYIDAIIYEMNSLKEQLKNYNLNTIYIGGGTPSSLDIKDLERLLLFINENYVGMRKIEFTIEAGREDTLSYEKMKLFKDYNINRISLNPQTFKKETLNLIGRKQDNDELIKRYYDGLSLGFESINMDLIIGLPNESLEDLSRTLGIVAKLSPSDLTVHTLAIKKGSKFKEKSIELKQEKEHIEDMMNIIQEFAKNNEYIPYYLYRQKQILGNMENIGFSKKDKECIYNITMMEEVENIVGIGMGASSKFIKKNNRIENYRNYMNMRDYLNSLDKEIKDKLILLGEEND